MRLKGRTSQMETSTAIRITEAPEVSPTMSSFRRAEARKPPKPFIGLPTLTAPAISPFQRMGALTYMTVLRRSSGFSSVVRAPYSPSRVRRTSRQRRKSWPSSRPKESNTTVPFLSVT